MQSKFNQFSALPNEILDEILGALSPMQLYALSNTSKQLKEMIWARAEIWKKLYKTYFPFQTAPRGTWADSFTELYFSEFKKLGYRYEFKDLSEGFKNDKEFVIEAVKRDYNALSFVSEKFQDDKEIALAAVKKDCRALKDVSERLRDDTNFMLEACLSDRFAFSYASDRLTADKKFVLSLVEKWDNMLNLVSDQFKNDKDIVLAAVKNDGCSLAFASSALQDDKEVVLAAVKNHGWALMYASDRLRNDKEIVLAAMKNNKQAIDFASDELQDELSSFFSQRKAALTLELPSIDAKTIEKNKQTKTEFKNITSEESSSVELSDDNEKLSLTQEELKEVGRKYKEYKDNHFFGLAWLTTSQESAYCYLELYGAETDEERYQIAINFIKAHPDNQLTKELKEVIDKKAHMSCASTYLSTGKI